MGGVPIGAGRRISGQRQLKRAAHPLVVQHCARLFDGGPLAGACGAQILLGSLLAHELSHAILAAPASRYSVLRLTL